MQLPAPLLRFLDGHIGALPDHKSRERDRLVVALFRAMVLACAGFAAFPVWVALGGPGGVFAASAFFWTLAPFPLALALARPGSVRGVELVSAAGIAGAVASLAAFSGGIASPFAAWFVLVPLIAGGIHDRLALMQSGALAGLAFGLVACLDALGLFPAGNWTGAGTAAVHASLLLTTFLLLGRPAEVSRGAVQTASQVEREPAVTDIGMDLVTRHRADGWVDFVSPSSEALFGLRAADLAGDGFARRVHVADRPKYLSALSNVLAGGGDAAVEFRLLRASGDAGRPTQAWVEMRCRALTGSNGRLVAAIAVTRDISDRKVLEAEGEEARLAAEGANAARSRFLAEMSHELRTPLNSMIGFSELMCGEPAGECDESRRRDYARLIRQCGDHLLASVNDLLDVSKIEAGMFTLAPEHLNLGVLARECAAIMEPQAKARSLAVECHIEEDLPAVSADRQACRRILLNLLSNAIKFSPVGGTVAIGARDTGSEVALSVADRGIGIAAGDLPRLGIPFFQVESTYNRNNEGTGLGLSIVKGLASLHGGAMSIDSTAGHGTTVTVTLPVVSGSTGAGTTGGIAGLLNRERKIA